MNRPADLMPLFERRRLTDGEITLGRAIFGNEISWKSVRVMQLPPLGFVAMVPFGRTIVYSRLPARKDFAAAPDFEQGVFVHELAHVWQAGRGVVLAFAKLKALGRKSYKVEVKHGAALMDYNIESQAEIARLLFLSRLGKSETPSPPRDWLEAIWTRKASPRDPVRSA
jgi:hypothetical protein